MKFNPFWVHNINLIPKFSFQDTSSKLITIDVPPNSYEVIKIPIKPLSYGRLIIHARPNDDSERFLSAQTQVEEEGYQISKVL